MFTIQAVVFIKSDAIIYKYSKGLRILKNLSIQNSTCTYVDKKQNKYAQGSELIHTNINERHNSLLI